jgi:Concanavalin A-like lectin/glucanases superfamily
MSKLFTRFLVQASLSVCCALLGLNSGEDKPNERYLAHFRFNGDAKDASENNPDFELKNAEFKDNTLYLNGRYELELIIGGESVGYRAVCETKSLDYENFSVALRFEAEDFGLNKNNLITGGTSSRWFGLERSPNGNLVVTLNNNAFQKELTGVTMEKGKWTVVACSVNILERKVIAALNGKVVAVIDLPKDFKMAVTKWEQKDSDKVWAFTNYSTGKVFHGRVDELLIYRRALNAEELEKIPLQP